jgi:hypothetical protein
MNRIPKTAPPLPDLAIWKELWTSGSHNYGKRMRGLRACARDAANGNRRAKEIMAQVWEEHARRVVLARLKS